MDATTAAIFSPMSIALLVLAVGVVALAGPIARRRIPDGLDAPYPDPSADAGGRDAPDEPDDGGDAPTRRSWRYGDGAPGADYAPSPDPHSGP